MRTEITDNVLCYTSYLKSGYSAEISYHKCCFVCFFVLLMRCFGAEEWDWSGGLGGEEGG